MIRGTRRPGGAGRRSSGRKMRRGKEKGCLVLAIVGFGLMFASGVGLIWLAFAAPASG